MRSGSEKLPGPNEPDMRSTWAPPSLLCSPKPPFAHATIALCRAFNLPARNVTGHLPDQSAVG